MSDIKYNCHGFACPYTSKIESLTAENERLREAQGLSSYSIKQLRDGIEDIPNDKRASYVIEMCRIALSPNSCGRCPMDSGQGDCQAPDCLSPNEKPGGGE